MEQRDSRGDRERALPLRPSHLAPLPARDLQSTARDLYDSLDEGTRDLNITRVLLRHPDLLRAFTGFGTYFLETPLVSVRDRELVILRVAWLCRCEYVWGQHVALSRREGVTEAEIERVRHGPDASGWADVDRDLLRAADELHAEAAITSETWSRLAERFEPPQLLELIFTAGQYGLVCRVANSCGIPLDAGLPGLFDDA